MKRLGSDGAEQSFSPRSHGSTRPWLRLIGTLRVDHGIGHTRANSCARPATLVATEMDLPLDMGRPDGRSLRAYAARASVWRNQVPAAPPHH